MSKNTSRADVVETVPSASNDIISAIGELSATLTSTLGSPQSEKYIFGITIAISGALSAYLFNLLHWKIVEKKRKVSQISGELNTLIERLESMAVKYWIQDYSNQNKEENNIIEVTLKSKLRLINHLIKASRPTLDKCNRKSINNNLKKFQSEIFELVTAGEFESINRKASKARAMKISYTCSDIRVKMLSLVMDI